MDHGIVTDIATCIIAAWVVGVVCRVVRQPLLIAYLVAGFVIGPHGLRFITDPESIQTISEIVTVLCDGSVLAQGTLDQVQNDERVIEVYLGR